MVTVEAVQDHLNGQSGFILAVFIVVSFFVIWPVRIPFPKPVQRGFLFLARFLRVIDKHEHESLSKSRLRFPLSLQTAPIIGVILLLAATTIHGSTVSLGVKGDADIKPYEVLVLFISLVHYVPLAEKVHV